MIGEPVFLFPLFSIIFKIDFKFEIFILILIFQIFSISSIQIGKVNPPDFQFGFVSSLIAYLFSDSSLTFSILIGLIFSFVSGYFYDAKTKLNFFLSRLPILNLGIFLSVSISFLFSFALLLFEYIVLKDFVSVKTENVYLVMFALIFAQTKISKLNKKIEIFLFIIGILLGLLCILAISKYF